MAKQRIVNTRFWDDLYITSLTPLEKLLFLYLLTNPLTSICGIYELPFRRILFDTGIEKGELEAILKKFEEDKKMVFENGWIGIKNFIKHQSLNIKVRQGIILGLEKAPKGILDRLSIDYDSLSHLNLNPNYNPNLNTNIKVPLEKVFGNVKKIGSLPNNPT